MLDVCSLQLQKAAEHYSSRAQRISHWNNKRWDAGMESDCVTAVISFTVLSSIPRIIIFLWYLHILLRKLAAV